MARFRHEVGAHRTRVGLYCRLGALPRRRTPAPVWRVWPGRRVGLWSLSREARAVWSTVLRTLWGAGAVARAPLRRVQWPAAGICECSRCTRVRGRCARLRRIVEGARPTRPGSRRRRSRRIDRSEAGRRCHFVRPGRPRPGARTRPCLCRCARLRAFDCLVDSTGCAAAAPAGHRSPTRPAPKRTSRERGARVLRARRISGPSLSRG